MRFTKMHGLGNDFILVDMTAETLFEAPGRLAEAICHRHFGVGADGLVLVHPSRRADCRMQIFNSDGSEAESCGNALRCVAKFIYDRGKTRGTVATVEALAGIYTTVITPRAHKAHLIKVNMGVPELRPSAFPAMVEGEGPVVDLPLYTEKRAYRGVLVNTGVPHVVIFVPSLTDFDFITEGRQIERNPLFPKWTNVNFVEVKNPEYLEVKVWERGAGPTLACGTGASAVLVAAYLTNRSPRRATVSLPGGELVIEWSEEDGNVYMTGPAVVSFTGEYR